MQNEILMIGILLSVVFTEITGLSPGGVIVPAYIALAINEPRRIAYTYFAAVLTYLIVRVMAARVILYGRRTFAACLAISFILHLLFNAMKFPVPGYVSFLVTGVLAREFDRQGVKETSVSLVLVSAVLVLMMISFNVVSG